MPVSVYIGLECMYQYVSVHIVCILCILLTCACMCMYLFAIKQCVGY